MPRYRRVAKKPSTVEEMPVAEPVPEPVPQTLTEPTKAELIALADERGIDSSGTKAELIARLGL